MAEGTQHRLAAIVSADVIGYSRLMGVDEARTLADLRAHRAELIDAKIDKHGGRIVKTMGEALGRAGKCAEAIQAIDVALRLSPRDPLRFLFLAFIVPRIQGNES